MFCEILKEKTNKQNFDFFEKKLVNLNLIRNKQAVLDLSSNFVPEKEEAWDTEMLGFKDAL